MKPLSLTIKQFIKDACEMIDTPAHQKIIRQHKWLKRLSFTSFFSLNFFILVLSVYYSTDVCSAAGCSLKVMTPSWVETIVFLPLTVASFLFAILAANFYSKKQEPWRRASYLTSSLMQNETKKNDFFNALKNHPEISAQFNLVQLEKKIDTLVRKLNIIHDNPPNTLSFIFKNPEGYDTKIYHLIEPVFQFCLEHYQTDITPSETSTPEPDFFFQRLHSMSMNEKP